ncbi:hypothetical protein AB0M44_37510 [Streptosporangium subroseum]|uniref:hypothetical protein n=1 Tax=Streptosporangium subroseum TaxID=106412 RepID=UPI003426E38D
MEESGAVTPCKHCGTPIEQRSGRGRPRAYCLQGDCQAVAKREREMRRATPGLEGALARAEEFYDRMEKGMTAAIAPLAQVLADELSPAGVEAKLSAVQAEAHTRVAIARTEREQAFEQVRLAREATGHARREREAMAQQMAQQVEEAHAERDTALADAENAREQALAALHEAASTERLARHAEQEAARRAERAEAARDAAMRERAEKVEAAETEARQARAQAVQHGQQAEQAQAERDQARGAAEADQNAKVEAERAAAAAAARAQAAESERDRALARADAEAHARGQALAETAEARARAARVEKQAAELEKRTARQLARAEERAAEKISEAQDRAAGKVAEAHAERDQARMQLAMEQMRLSDLREQVEVLRTEAARLQERAITAELRAKAEAEGPGGPGAMPR